MELGTFLQKYQSYLDKIIEYQNIILDFDEDPENFDPNRIIPEEILKEKQNLMPIFHIFRTGLYSRPKKLEIFMKLYYHLLPHLIKQFDKLELMTFLGSPNLILPLYKDGIINDDDILYLSHRYIHFPSYFLPEIRKMNKCEEFSNDDEFSKYQSYPEEDFISSRNAMKNESLISDAIRNDDIETFQFILSQTEMSVNESIPYSIFEINIFINLYEDMPKLIEYAAFFESIKIFKFLWNNNANITNNLLGYAIAGGSYEIVHIIEEKINSISLKSTIDFAIRSHRNDFIEYFLSKHEDYQFAVDEVARSIRNYNLTIFKKTLPILFRHPNSYDNKFFTPLISAVINGFSDLVDMILDIKWIDVNRIGCYKQITPLMLAAKHGNIDICKILVEKGKADVNFELRDTNVLYYANISHQAKVIEYFLQTQNKLKLETIKKEFLFSITNSAVDVVKIIYKKIKMLDESVSSQIIFEGLQSIPNPITPCGIEINELLNA